MGHSAMLRGKVVTGLLPEAKTWPLVHQLQLMLTNIALTALGHQREDSDGQMQT